MRSAVIIGPSFRLRLRRRYVQSYKAQAPSRPLSAYWHDTGRNHCLY